MEISHAFVRFKSGLDSIVPVNLVNNFSPKNSSDFEKRKKYKVWSDNKGKKGLLLNANILLLGTSQQDLEKRMKNKNLTPRTKENLIKKRNDQKLHKRANNELNNRILEKYSTLLESRESLKETNSKHLEEDEDTVLLPPDSDSDLDEHDDQMRRIQEEINGQDLQLPDINGGPQSDKTQRSQADEEIESNPESERHSPRGNTSSDSLQDSQGRIYVEKRIENIRPGRSSATDTGQVHQDRIYVGQRIQNPRSGSSTNPDSLNDFEERNNVRQSIENSRPGRSTDANTAPVNQNRNYVGQRLETPNDWVYLTDDIKLHVDVWEEMRGKSDSRFVKELAQTLWGMGTLKQRCLDEKRRAYRQEGEEPRLPLTPEKLTILKNCVYNKITDSKVEGKMRAPLVAVRCLHHYVDI